MRNSYTSPVGITCILYIVVSSVILCCCVRVCSSCIHNAYQYILALEKNTITFPGDSDKCVDVGDFPTRLRETLQSLLQTEHTRRAGPVRVCNKKLFLSTGNAMECYKQSLDFIADHVLVAYAGKL